MYKINGIYILIILLAISFSANSKIWVLSNYSLDVSFNDETALFSITDKRCRKIWEQTDLVNKFKVNKTERIDNALKISLESEFPFIVYARLISESALEIEIQSDSRLTLNEFTFPTALQTPNENHYVLFTDGEGFLLKADDREYGIGRQIMHSMRGLSMPWMGVTDDKFQSGYMAILNTPDDCEMNVKRTNGLISFEPVWLSQKSKFGYNRKITYYFFDKGGYVAQCKKYREYIWAQQEIPPTLLEKQKRFPAIEKMIGAMHIYLWDDAREVSFAQEMKDSEIDKAFILWNPNHPPYPVDGYDNEIKKLGYLSGVYELFRDVHLRDTSGVIDPSNRNGTWLNRFRFPGLFHQIALIEKDGGYHYSGFGYDTNPKAVLPHIPELRTDREMQVYPHESTFLDGYFASGIFEDYSKENPLTRTDYKEAVIEMNKFFEEKYNQIVGVEWGADYGIPTSAYAHGMMTLHHMLYPSPDRNKKGSIYYVGDWSNPSNPSIMVGEYVADKAYLKWAINEKIRVPLYQLVYHDAIVTTWRWDDNSHNMPEIWWKKDLFNILYGTAPVWCLDRARWKKFKQTFIESYKNVGPWLEQIGYDEMINHQFLTDDHTVQETEFSSGKKVVVNFGYAEVSFYGKILKAHSFMEL